MAPVTIREITRRVHLEGITQLFTAGGVTKSCWHLQVLALVPKSPEADWSQVLPLEQKHDHAAHHEAVPTARLPRWLGCDQEKDIPIVHQLSRYLSRFFTTCRRLEEVEHWFYPQENIIDTFVVENANGRWLISWAFVYTSVHHHGYPTHKVWRLLTLSTMFTLQTPLLNLRKLRTSSPKWKGLMCSMLDLMENKPSWRSSKFGIGDGSFTLLSVQLECPSMGGREGWAGVTVTSCQWDSG